MQGPDQSNVNRQLWHSSQIFLLKFKTRRKTEKLMAKIAAGCGTFYGATTLRIKAITIMTLSIMTLSLMALGMNILSIRIISIMSLNKMTLA